MAISVKIQKNVVADFQLRLTNEGITDNFAAGTKRAASGPFPAVSVGILSCEPDILQGGGIIAGFWRVDLLLDAISYLEDDTDGSAARDLAGDVMEAFSVDDIIADMNTLTTYNTYYQVVFGASTMESEDRFHHVGIPVTTRLRPEKP